MTDDKKKPNFHYFVDGTKYETESAALTGVQIKSRLPDFNPQYQLVLEGHAKEPDKVIGDSETEDLTSNPPKHFYTVPPATFGL